MCEQLLANPLIEDYEIVEESRDGMKFGVVRFPGSCDERRCAVAAARVGEAVLLWHADRDLQGVDAVIVPGGFSYGDYLRVGAIARFAPVMEAVAEFAARRRPGARHLQRLSGPLRGRPASRRAAAQHLAAVHLPPGRPRGRRPRTPPSPAPARRASGCRFRSSTRPAATSPTRARLTSCCATPPVRTPTAPRTTSPVCATRRATCSG